MYEQLSKPLKMDGIQISLLDVTCLIYMQNDYALFLVQKFIFG